ncbi:MAG: prephenate dehydrogenase, partial [Omnitrophica WOR_2 bacterium]
MEALPARFDPVGGHPMCGKEVSGLANAGPALFHNAAFILSALSRTSAKARSLAIQLVEAVGAHPLWLDGQVHDRWVAATSHLPFLLANSLAFCTPEETAGVVGPGFRSTARLAPSSPRMMRDILETNQAQILLALRHFSDRLSQVEGLIRQGKWDELERMFEQGTDQYRRLVPAAVGGGEP